MKRVGIYAGSFDPPTNGHLWMIRRGAELFDELVVVLAINPEKKSLLSIGEREGILEQLVAGVPGQVRLATVEHGFLVDFARKAGADFLLRGIRSTVDFEYEKPMARMNARMGNMQTVFLMPPGDLEDVSSSMVRGFVGLPGWEHWVKACVPPCAFDAISTKIGKQ